MRIFFSYYVGLLLIILSGLLHVEAKADESINPYDNNIGREDSKFFHFQIPDKEIPSGEISVPLNLLKNGRGECLYADERYIVIREIEKKGRDNHSQNENGEDKEYRFYSARTGFYDSRTLEPVFYVSFGAMQVEFNRDLGIFALSYDGLVRGNTLREVAIVLVNPDNRKGSAMTFTSSWLGGDEMSWNGKDLELRIGWGPMRKTFEVFRFDKPFLKHPVSVRSIDTSKESEKSEYFREIELQSVRKKKEFEKIWKISNSLGCGDVLLSTGRAPGCIAFTEGRDVINHLDFNHLKYEAVEIPGKQLANFGAYPNQTMWMISKGQSFTCFFTVTGEDGKCFSYECPVNIHVSPDGKEAWNSCYVFDVTQEGMLPKFEAPEGNIVGVDFINREVYVQSNGADKYREDIDSWKDHMSPSSYDLDTGKLKLKKCSWFEVGEPSQGYGDNEGCESGIAPKGWRLSTHHTYFKRLNGSAGSIEIRLPSGKDVFYGEGALGTVVPVCGASVGNDITANQLAALYPCGKEAKFMLLLYSGVKGGQAVAFNAKTLRSHEIASWSSGNPLWLEEKQWLFVPRIGYYDVIHIDEQGSGKILFSLYYAKRGYAIALPNGLYAGSPGCESMIQYRNEMGGMERLAPWRNRPGEVLEALGGDSDSIKLLKEATKRWHRKINFAPETPQPALKELPVAEVKQLPELFSSIPNVSVPVVLTATVRPIDKYSFKINGVETIIPLKASISSGQTHVVDCDFTLGEGVNWVEIRAVDEKGIMGSAVRFRLIGRGISQKNLLYLVSLGVSDYKNEELNLRYAAKDAKDFSLAMETLYGDQIRILTLTDGEATRDSMKKIRDFLTNEPNPGDSVVFYCAGHGVLDEQWRYIFACYEFDPEHPGDTGIIMDDLKGCLSASKARNRLLLMDTCHSGMIGEEDEVKLAKLSALLPQGISLVQSRGMKARVNPQLDAVQKHRFIEEMFAFSSGMEGMAILGASGGGEFAQESGEWNNGVFTRSLIEGLRDSKADTDLDGSVHLDELKNYLAIKVPEMTKGQQKPSLVSFNSDQNFILAQDSSPKLEKMTLKLDMSDDGLNPANYIEARGSIGNGNRVDYIDVLKDVFADQVDYQYIKGKLVSPFEIIEDIKSGWAIWSARTYTLLAAGRKDNMVEVVYSYNLFNREKDKRAKGYTKETWTLNDQGKIVKWREQVSRKDVPALSPEIIVAVNNSDKKYSPKEYVECRQNGYVNVLAGMFADQVDYQYVKGKIASREEVVMDIAAGFQKWPERNYSLVEAGKKGNTVEVIYSYSIVKPGSNDSNKYLPPIYGCTKETWTLNDQGKIIKWRETISKKAPLSLTKGMYILCM